MSEKRIYFSDFFNIDPNVLENYGAFNISLLNDLPLFIDPFLIFCSENEEYQNLHSNIVSYMMFLRDQAQEVPTPSQGMLAAWYLFREVKQTYLGFCIDGNCGHGLGHDFAIALHNGLKDIFKDFGREQITRSPHLEKLCLIKDHVGPDNISDFVTNLIKEYLLEYTEDFAKKHLDSQFCKNICVSKVRFNYEIRIWESAKYYLPYFNDDYVLLTPMNMLVHDETWINKNDFHSRFEGLAASLPGETLRFQVNQYFQELLSKKPTKKERIAAAQKTIQYYPEVIDYYIRDREDNDQEAIKTSVSEVGEVKQLFYTQLQGLIKQLKDETDFYDKAPTSFNEALQRILHLKHVIENCDGYKWFYDGDQPIRREADLHIMYKLTCYDTFSDANSEVNNGRGPVDFKLSNGSKDSTLVEFKLTRTLKKNLEKQVEVYKNANRTDKAIKVILYFSEDEYKKTIAILNDLDLAEKPGIVLIDARSDNKGPASKTQ